MEKVSEIEKYIYERYLETRWPFFNYMILKLKFGEKCLKDLKKMKSEGKIRLRGHINGYLIEVINFEKWDNKTLKV
jgi:hypothetical protein